MGLEVIQIDTIGIDNEVQLRERMDEDAVYRYAEDLDRLPPIHVFQEDVTYWLADGFHRVQAQIVQMKTEIMAYVEPGLGGMPCCSRVRRT